MREETVIVIRGLTRCFGDVVAVDDLSLTVCRGEVFGSPEGRGPQWGRHALGRSTVRLLNGVLSPSAGSARVLGLDPLQDGPAPTNRRAFGVTETPSLEERLTARENLRIYAEIYGVPDASLRTELRPCWKPTDWWTGPTRRPADTVAG